MQGRGRASSALLPSSFVFFILEKVSSDLLGLSNQLIDKAIGSARAACSGEAYAQTADDEADPHRFSLLILVLMYAADGPAAGRVSAFARPVHLLALIWPQVSVSAHLEHRCVRASSDRHAPMRVHPRCLRAPTSAVLCLLRGSSSNHLFARLCVAWH
eukprot:1800431-Pleurochrysis_carterae.AAC.2